MKQNTAKRALLMSALSLLLCVSMLVGTTFAWFTDSVVSGNNIIQSGNLDVEMMWAEGQKAVPAADSADWKDASQTAIFDYQLWEPGFVQVRHVKIQNAGSLALKYQLAILANGEVSQLADVIDVYYLGTAAQIKNRSDLAGIEPLGSLSDVLKALPTTASGDLKAGESDVVTIALKMRESAGNQYQNLSIGAFSVVLNATQLVSEYDSFGPEYDQDASTPTYSAPTQLPESGPMTIGDEDFNTELPEALVDDLRGQLGDEKLSLKLAGRKADAAKKTVSFSSADLVDQNNNVVDLTGNDKPFVVNVDVSDSFVEGERVKIYHDDRVVAEAVVDAEGYIHYEAYHFCEILIADNATVFVHNAEEFIAILTEIRTLAKTMIPGENGNKQYRVKANIVLEDDIVIDGETPFMYTDSNGAPLHFYGFSGTLDLNGHTITATSDALKAGKTYANAVLLFQYSNVAIKGEGAVISQNQAKAVYAWANCTVDIHGGTYISNSSDRNCSAVYVNNASAKINVYGGTYTETAYAFNVHDNCGSTPVIQLHEGITFADFLKNGTTDVIASDINKGRIVLAEGCRLEQYEENGVAMNKVVKE